MPTTLSNVHLIRAYKSAKMQQQSNLSVSESLRVSERIQSLKRILIERNIEPKTLA